MAIIVSNRCESNERSPRYINNERVVTREVQKVVDVPKVVTREVRSHARGGSDARSDAGGRSYRWHTDNTGANLYSGTANCDTATIYANSVV